ncbi:MAG: energy transducer TonB [Flavobacteriales bacterium]|jgi:protein TonB|nr:energy transducer TonB [Flavobacteriales bacterium]
MFRFIGKHLRYPTDIEIQGKVVVEFVIDTTGAVVEARSIRGSGASGLDNEAIRVVKSMPQWTPGEVDGRKVRTRFMLPVYIDPK